ncbi:MAG TPA: cytochrome P450 [Rhodopila sp.]|nr:cytochrome P450 [Rhodopila sp.]
MLSHSDTGEEAVLQPPGRRALAHIPGDNGWPVIGHTLQALADPKAFFENRAQRFGLIFRSDILTETSVYLLGPDANELVLVDPQRLFSSRFGWTGMLDRVFPGGLIMMDFDEHRLHRRALSIAFKAGPMRSYLAALDASIAARIAAWRAAPGPMQFYPAVKQLTLDLAATAFLGGSLGPAMDQVSRALVDMVAATVSPVRRALPGTQLYRGMKARERIVDWLGQQIPIRRERGGDDLLSQLCQATTESGALLTAEAVVDHMSFLMMAAHDTLTSSLSAFTLMLARNPDWQDRLREEINQVVLDPHAPLSLETLDSLRLTEMAFKEALRMIPPVPALPRRALRDFRYKGYEIPAGAGIGINLLFTHHMPDIWPDPDQFDPMRFTPEAQAARHRFAFVPFGGGAHMCLGLHYAMMQARCFAARLLQNVSVNIDPGYASDWKMWPIPKPVDGLLITIRSI